MATIPPVPSRVLESNHQFRALHARLTGEKENAEATGKPALLNPDGTTARLVEEGKCVAAETRELLARAMRRKVLLEALRKVVAGGHGEAELDADQPLKSRRTEHDARGEGGEGASSACESDDRSIKDDMSQLLQDDIERFKESIHVYVPALKSALESDVNFLKEMALVHARSSSSSSKQSPSERHRRPSKRFSLEKSTVNPKETLAVSLVDIISKQQAQLRNLQQFSVPNANRKLTSTTVALVAAHAELLESSLLLLSRGKHGTLARAQKARAELLKTEAAEVDVQAQLKHAEMLAKMYTSDVRAALDRYHKHLLSIEDDTEMQKRKLLALKEEKEL
ncbi:hypothetical protein KEM56_006576 [Ascosphaera pollenicola]|nr:hypothetical protein KEM56_006576 [Ascosphaera pollenicola]